MFSKKEFILGAIVFFWGGMAVGYTMARAKFIELMSKAALDSAIKNQHKEEEAEEDSRNIMRLMKKMKMSEEESE